MYSLCTNALLFLTVFILQTTLGEVSDKKKDKVDAALVSLPINSKFWNPQLDDKTNMELIGLQYLDDSNKTVVEVFDKSAQLSQGVGREEKNWTSLLTRPKRGERYFVWGLLNLMKPSSWMGGAMPGDLSLRANSKVSGKGAN